MPVTLADILGPWQEPDFDSGLITRCRNMWAKPLENLSNHELVTCLQQDLAVEHALPIAKKRLQEHIDDDTELFEGQLTEAVAEAERKKPNQPLQPNASTGSVSNFKSPARRG
jgi:hypothetical protein